MVRFRVHMRFSTRRTLQPIQRRLGKGHDRRREPDKRCGRMRVIRLCARHLGDPRRGMSEIKVFKIEDTFDDVHECLSACEAVGFVGFLSRVDEVDGAV